MIIKITVVWTRKDTVTNFWKAPAELLALNEPLIKSGDLTMSWSLSDDGLTMTQVSTFASEAVETAVLQDPVRLAFADQRNAYNAANDIEKVSVDRAEFNVNK